MKLLFVCTGNICRSPTADGILQAMIAEAGLSTLIEVDSAGTTSWHVGEPPSAPALRIAKRHGYDLSFLRARKVEIADFERFDLIFAMDRGHEQALLRLCPDGYEDRLRLFLSMTGDPSLGDEVEDPYYGGDEDYERALELIRIGCEAILKEVRMRLGQL